MSHSVQLADYYIPGAIKSETLLTARLMCLILLTTGYAVDVDCGRRRHWTISAGTEVDRNQIQYYAGVKPWWIHICTRGPWPRT